MLFDLLEDKMFNKYTILIFISILLLGSDRIFAQAKNEPAKELKWYEKVDFSGYVDVYYNYTFNNRQGGTADTSATFHTYNKQFAVNAVKLTIEKVAEKDSPWGFRMDLQNGQNPAYQERPFQTTNSIFNQNLLQQGFVSMYLPVRKGLVIDVGKMVTHIGYEVLDSKDNMNYTIGYIFFNTIPFINTGARATVTLTEKYSAGLYIYNSAQGTGYTGGAGTAGQQFGAVGVTPYGDSSLSTVPSSSLTNTTQHAYVDGPNYLRAYGTQLKGEVNDKFSFVWNTLYGDDNLKAARTKGDIIAENYLGYPIPNKPSQFSQDYWFVNNIILTFTLSEKLTAVFDWTFGERKGETVSHAFGYLNPNITVDPLTGSSDFIGNDGVNDIIPGEKRTVKKIYNTYGLWLKYDINDKYSVAARFEAIDDSRYGGALAVNPPLFALTPIYRYDLLWKDANGLRAASSLGQARTFTITPIINFTENLQIKVDLRRDWALGNTFIDPAGRAVKGQNGIIVGIVAKF